MRQADREARARPSPIRGSRRPLTRPGERRTPRRQRDATETEAHQPSTYGAIARSDCIRLGAQLGAEALARARRRSAPAAAAASSSESVRSGDWNATRTRPTCGPRRPARRGRRRRRASRAAPARPPRARPRRGRRPATSSSTTNARSCFTAGNVITSSYWIGVARRARTSVVEVELEGAPRALEHAGWSSPTSPPRARAAFPGWSDGRASARSAARP